MYKIYLANNDADLLTGTDEGLQVPEINQPELPALPEDLNTESAVPTDDISDSNNYMQIISICSIVVVCLIFIIVFLKIVKSKLNKNGTLSSNIIDSDNEDLKNQSENKSFATPDNLKKCIKLFLENTRIR